MDFEWIAVSVLLFLLILWAICRKTRRITRTEDLPKKCAGTWLSGKVTSIPDGDGFRFFHCPWFRSTQYSNSADDKLYVRLAGIDAPEMGNSHMPQQPFAKESKEYLRQLILGKDIDIKVVGKDQYNRVLAFAYLPGSLPTTFLGVCFSMDRLCTNVNLEMVESGYAWVYTGRDAKYDQYKEAFKCLQEMAKEEKRGMWVQQNLVDPMRHKKMYK